MALFVSGAGTKVIAKCKQLRLKSVVDALRAPVVALFRRHRAARVRAAVIWGTSGIDEGDVERMEQSVCAQSSSSCIAPCELDPDSAFVSRFVASTSSLTRGTQNATQRFAIDGALQKLRIHE